MSAYVIWLLLHDDTGATFVEFALVMSLLSVVAMAGLAAFGAHAGTALQNQSTRFQNLQTGP